jgi:predicted Co/Zn/Cd cation transporter (cation efflux family)
MVWLAFMVLGAVLGAITALRRGGRKLDALQYATGFAIAFGLLGFALSVLILRLA